MVLIGYSGHAFVVYGILKASGRQVTGYCDVQEKGYNPFGLPYLGTEESADALVAMQELGFFISVGDNTIRSRVHNLLSERDMRPINAIHPSAMVDESVMVAANGVMISSHASINPLAVIGTGAICNTGCIIEHECRVGDFTHIGPGAVLCGNVQIGMGTFVGANAVVRQGITVGSGVMIGAGAVVVKDVADHARVVGVPAR
jgi:sugar O-acyltransferase (sialic acid O-acetyltransferase NeuD family)